MPWKVYRDGDEYCVHKLTDDDEKGEKESCHESREMANEAMAGLYAAENESKSIKEIVLNVISAFSPSGEDSGKSAGVEEEADSGEGNGEVPDDGGAPTEKDISSNNNGAGSEHPQATKMSLNDTIRHVSAAFDDEYGGNYYTYVHEVHPDFVIACYMDSHYRVPYTKEETGMGDDDNVVFADKTEWEEVEKKSEWVDKAADHFAVKALGGNRVGAYAVLWGDETAKDLDGEYFTPETEELKAIFEAIGALPWLFHHASDEEVKSTVVGVVDVMEEDDVGLWYEAKIREHEAYRNYVQRFIEDQKLFTSSGTLPGAKRVTKSGRITRWPIAEVTGTHIPAEWRMMDVPIEEIKSTYKAAGIDTAALEEYLGEGGEASADEADSEGVEETRKKLKAQLGLRQRRLQLLKN